MAPTMSSTTLASTATPTASRSRIGAAAASYGARHGDDLVAGPAGCRGEARAPSPGSEVCAPVCGDGDLGVCLKARLSEDPRTTREVHMESRTLGQGLRVSALGLGCMGMSQSYGPNPG